MTAAGRSVYLFGIYLMVVGAIILATPDMFLSLIRQPATQEPWLRILAVVTLALGQYYMVCGKLNAEAFIRASVRVRAFVFIAFGVMVALRWAPPVLLGFGLVDALGAAWTFMAARKSAAP